jgi:uncharacterized protein YcbK (DUF882 family)
VSQFVGISRRKFLLALGAVAAGAAAPGSAIASQLEPTVLWLERRGEAFLLDFATQQGYDAARYLLRDVQAHQIGYPSAPLLFALARTQAAFAAADVHRPYVVVSGMRVRATNDRTEGAARQSEHLPNAQGIFNAADVKLWKVSPDLVGRVALQEGAHGVGFYSGKEFTHIDGGRLRPDGTARVWRRQ